MALGWWTKRNLKEKDMKDNSIRKMWEDAARLQEFHTTGGGYAGPSRPDAAARAKEAAHVKHMHDTITQNGKRLEAEQAARIKASQAKNDILSSQGDYDMKHGPNGNQKATLDPKEQAKRALLMQRKNTK
jgi:hypothetical protein